MFGIRTGTASIPRTLLFQRVLHEMTAGSRGSPPRLMPIARCLQRGA